MGRRILRSFEALCRDPDIVLIDTSAILHSHWERDPESLGERITQAEGTISRLKTLREKVENKFPIYVSSMVLEEFGDSSFNNKSLRGATGELLKLRRLLKEGHKSRTRLIEALRDNGKILSLGEDEQKDYSFFAGEYSSLKEKYKAYGSNGA